MKYVKQSRRIFTNREKIAIADEYITTIYNLMDRLPKVPKKLIIQMEVPKQTDRRQHDRRKK